MSEQPDLIDDDTRAWARAWADETRRVQSAPVGVADDEARAIESFHRVLHGAPGAGAVDYAQPEHRTATLLERVVAAGIDPDRARALIVGGGVRVAGRDEPETDPETSVPKPTAWCFGPS